MKAATYEVNVLDGLSPGSGVVMPFFDSREVVLMVSAKDPDQCEQATLTEAVRVGYLAEGARRTKRVFYRTVGEGLALTPEVERVERSAEPSGA